MDITGAGNEIHRAAGKGHRTRIGAPKKVEVSLEDLLEALLLADEFVDVLRIGRQDVEGPGARIVSYAVRPLGQAVDLLDSLEPAAFAAIDPQALAAGVLDDEDLAVGGDGVRPGQGVVERLPTAHVAVEAAAPEHSVVPAVDEEIGFADLVEERGSEKAGLPARVVGRRRGGQRDRGGGGEKSDKTKRDTDHRGESWAGLRKNHRFHDNMRF